MQADFAGKGYGDFKGAVAEAVVALFAPVRERYAELMADPAELDRVLAGGAARAARGRRRDPARRPRPDRPAGAGAAMTVGLP